MGFNYLPRFTEDKFPISAGWDGEKTIPSNP